MKTSTKLAGVAGATLVATAVLVGDAPEKQHYTFEPDGDFLTGVEIEGGEGIPLARITLNSGQKLRPFMGPFAEPDSADTVKVRTWWVTLPNGRRAKLEMKGAYQMLEGETIEEARERFAQ